MHGNDQSMESNGTRVRHADPTHSQIPDEVSQVRKPPVLFLVIPCYREQEQLPITTPILERKMGSMIDAKMISQSSRILFVDDGSQDHTWQVIEGLHRDNPMLFHGIRLAHNRGHQNALLAGLMTALEQGCDVAASMDADLQDDVDALDRMLDEHAKGAQIVYGVRSSRDKDTWFKRTTAEAFYSV